MTARGAASDPRRLAAARPKRLARRRVSLRIILALSLLAAVSLLGEVLAPSDGLIHPAAVVALILAGTMAALCAAPPRTRRRETPDHAALVAEEMWIAATRGRPAAHLAERLRLGWPLHAVYVDHAGTRVVLRHLVNEITTWDARGRPTRCRVRVLESRAFTGDQVVDAALALDELRDAATEAEAAARQVALERESDRQAAAEAARIAQLEADERERERAREQALAEYRSRLEHRLHAQRTADERADAEREARGLADALRRMR